MKMEKRKELKKRAGRAGALLLIFVMLLAMSGCRESMVIQEIIYDQASKDIDFQNQMKLAKNNENSQKKDKTLPRQKNDKTDKKADIKHQASKKGKKDNNGEAPNTTHNRNSKNNTKNDSNGTKPGKSGEKEQASEDDSSAGASNNPNDRQIYDGNGNVVDLPEEVNSVVVTGDAASLIQMMGGKDIVSGSSSSFTNNSLAQEVFGLSNKTKTLWDGDGDTAMSSSNFNQLLAMKPDVCVYVSGQNSFSGSQLATLKKKKIACVVLPRFNTADNIQDAVNVAAEMIGDRSDEDGGVNAKDKAEEYERYCRNLVSEVKGKTGLFTWNNTDFNNDYDSTKQKKTANSTAKDGQYTLYVSQWEDCTYKIASGSTTLFEDSSGVAISPQGYSNSPLSYYLSTAGVCNNGARFIENAKSEYAVTPFNRNVFKHTSSGSYSFYGSQTESFTRVKSGSTDVALGDSDFKAIIVDSKAAKNKIENSETWDFHDRVKVGNVTDFGIERNGELINSYIRSNDWDIYVNPCGVESWTEGSVESVLETKWAAWKFHNGSFSETDVKNEIKEFYKTFYNYDLSNSQTNMILAGN